MRVLKSKSVATITPSVRLSDLVLRLAHAQFAGFVCLAELPTDAFVFPTLSVTFRTVEALNFTLGQNIGI